MIVALPSGRRVGRAVLPIALALVALLPAAVRADEPAATVLRPDPGAWAGAMAAAQERLSSATSARPRMEAWFDLERRFPIECDWLQQDGAPECGLWLGSAALATRLRAALARVAPGAPAPDDLPALLRCYAEACAARRADRLATVGQLAPRVVFTKHYVLGGSHYAYTEGVSDAIYERHFVPGSALCLLTVDGDACRIETLLDDPGGVLRDPDVSYDGTRVLFAWKRGDLTDDYHLYEIDPATRSVRQLTAGLGVADYEGAYLPDGRIVFNSTRCIQFVDCWWTEVSNLYSCDAAGGDLRRLTYDQVHDNYPTVTDDGRVLYTRWEYMDRGQIYPQALFSMAVDGTAQTEFYGNNSWFPTTLLHARGVPGSREVVAIATGHHTLQVGKLVRVDPALGRQEAEGVELLAPLRSAEAVRVDAYGQDGELFQYPYPLTEREFLVSYHPTGWAVPGVPEWNHPWSDSFEPRFRLYWMDEDGRRELLASDPRFPCGQAVALRPRRAPSLPPSQVDESSPTATYVLQDIYRGPGLAGIPRGAVRKLRVVAIDYRPAAIRENGSEGLAGGALSSTPVSIGNGAWDVKRVLGEVEVGPDGAAAFLVPARTPVYFQALDEQGHAIQTMRSWSTLQPGERMACVGCHESKNSVPPAEPRAFPALASDLPAVAAEAPGFSFARQIQPILDRHCVSCHADRSHRALDAGGVTRLVSDSRQLLATGSRWRYVTTDPGPGWEQPDHDDGAWSWGTAAFGVEGTPGLTVRTRWDRPAIWLRGAFTLPQGLGDVDLYALVAYDDNVVIHLNGTHAASRTGYAASPVPVRLSPEARATLREGANTIAVYCENPLGGGQGVDLALLAVPRRSAGGQAFSLLATTEPEERSGRLWSDSYLALTNAALSPLGYLQGATTPLVNWVDAQSVPSMLPPYTAGAARSGLLALLRDGHGGVRLTEDELRTLACWIDLAVPYCGDYAEANAWTPEERALYERYLAKRHRERVERGP